MNFTAGKAGRINPSLFPKAKRKNTRHLSTQPSAKSSSSSSSGVQEGGGGPAKRTVCLAVSACKHSATCYHWCASVTAGTMLWTVTAGGPFYNSHGIEHTVQEDWEVVVISQLAITLSTCLTSPCSAKQWGMCSLYQDLNLNIFSGVFSLPIKSATKSCCFCLRRVSCIQPAHPIPTAIGFFALLCLSGTWTHAECRGEPFQCCSH